MMLLSFNFHPAVVHFPIAFFLLATASGLLFMFWSPRTELRVLTWSGVALGLVGAVVATLTGLLDQAGLPPDAPYRPILNQHIGTGLGQIIVYGLLLYRWRVFGLPRARRARQETGAEVDDLLAHRPARWWVAALLILGALLVIASGFNGGRLVYEWGVNVMQ